MKRYTKYDKLEFDVAKVREGNKRARENAKKRKVPTSVALDPDFVSELKDAADMKGVPYQVLMRMFIVDGFKKFKQKDL
jgi:predicted DNA binding CopG/RHH family protein